MSIDMPIIDNAFTNPNMLPFSIGAPPGGRLIDYRIDDNAPPEVAFYFRDRNVFSTRRAIRRPSIRLRWSIHFHETIHGAVVELRLEIPAFNWFGQRGRRIYCADPDTDLFELLLAMSQQKYWHISPVFRGQVDLVIESTASPGLGGLLARLDASPLGDFMSDFPALKAAKVMTRQLHTEGVDFQQAVVLRP